ncbi:MAG: Rdx family protein [Planctomycetes bacterium]|nr:Rdx family protein [Planctomycetota bacterium]
MAAAIEKEYGIQPKLIKGGGGIFDIIADGKMIFSKHEVGRFPEEAEILEALRGL